MTSARKSCSLSIRQAVLSAAFAGVLAASSAGDAAAASSQWQDVGGGQVRLVAIKDPAQGTLSGVVEVRLDKGWKTYWRSPGSSGIAPEFDFSGSKATEVDRVRFPAPMRMKAGESIFYGYKDTVAFPFYGLAGIGETELRLDLLIGICEEICIPATASLAITSDELNVSDPKAQMQIMLAETFLPQAPADDLRITDFKQHGNRLELKIHSVAVETALHAVVWPRDSEWVSDPVKAERQEDGSFLTVFHLPEGVDVPDAATGAWSFALLLEDAADGQIKKVYEDRINTNSE
ncbi:MAG: hypothetical protein KDJ69_07285 [Nitratireductor sp.]|nr:hypothetical protein [Nitratireductor sp.]